VVVGGHPGLQHLHVRLEAVVQFRPARKISWFLLTVLRQLTGILLNIFIL
jgi:hypothetical protein